MEFNPNHYRRCGDLVIETDAGVSAREGYGRYVTRADHNKSLDNRFTNPFSMHTPTTQEMRQVLTQTTPDERTLFSMGCHLGALFDVQYDREKGLLVRVISGVEVVKRNSTWEVKDKRAAVVSDYILEKGFPGMNEKQHLPLAFRDGVWGRWGKSNDFEEGAYLELGVRPAVLQLFSADHNNRPYWRLNTGDVLAYSRRIGHIDAFDLAQRRAIPDVGTNYGVVSGPRVI